MKGQDTLFSNASDEWETPQDVFDSLDAEFHFDLDPCASSENHKCQEYFTREDDGLTKMWGGTECSVIHRIARSLNGFASVMRNH